MKKFGFTFASLALLAVFTAFGVRADALPDGYHALAYIEGTGTQWIDTGLVPDGTTTLTAEYQLTDWSKCASAYVFGVWADGNVGRMQFSYKINENTLFLGYGVSYDNTSVTCTPDTARHTVELDDATFYLDGEKLSPTKPTTASGYSNWSWKSGGKKLYLFACDGGRHCRQHYSFAPLLLQDLERRGPGARFRALREQRGEDRTPRHRAGS